MSAWKDVSVVEVNPDWAILKVSGVAPKWCAVMGLCYPAAAPDATLVV
jgi:hypothetical protein